MSRRPHREATRNDTQKLKEESEKSRKAHKEATRNDTRHFKEGAGTCHIGKQLELTQSNLWMGPEMSRRQHRKATRYDTNQLQEGTGNEQKAT